MSVNIKKNGGFIMKMKKILGSLLAVMMLASLVACGGSDSGTATEADKTTEGVKAAPKEAITMTFAHTTSETTAKHNALIKFKELVEANSDGQIKVEVYPSGQLGTDRSVFEDIQNGSITGMVCNPAVEVAFVPSANIFDLPFVYDGMAHGRAVLADPDFIAAINSEYEKANIHLLGVTAQGFRNLTANEKIISVDQLKGIKIRTMENEYHMQLWSLLGSNPTPTSFNELYTALQQGTVDAQENPIELIHSQKLYEQQKYIMATDHIIQSDAWTMSKEVYDSLSDELKTVVDDATKEAMDYYHQYGDDNDKGNRETIEAYGCEFVEVPKDQLDKMQELSAPVYESIKSTCDSTVYESFLAAVEKNKTQ